MVSSDGVKITGNGRGGLNVFEPSTGRTHLSRSKAAALRAHFVAERMPEDVQALVNEAHRWCPACGGSGMVMEFEPTDCPNLAVHRALEAAYSQEVEPEPEPKYKMPGYDEVLEKLDALTIRKDN